MIAEAGRKCCACCRGSARCLCCEIVSVIKGYLCHQLVGGLVLLVLGLEWMRFGLFERFRANAPDIATTFTYLRGNANGS